MITIEGGYTPRDTRHVPLASGSRKVLALPAVVRYGGFMLENQAETEKLLRLYRHVRRRSRRLSSLIHETRLKLGPGSKVGLPRRKSPKVEGGNVLSSIPELENRLLEEIIQIEKSYQDMRTDLDDPLLAEEMGHMTWRQANGLLDEILLYFSRIKDCFRTKIC